MKLNRKITLITVISLIAALLCISAIIVSASDTETTSPITMYEGAWVRVEGNDATAVTGIRFAATVAKDTVTEWKSAYKSVKLGMLIMPEDYADKYGELNEDNVFGTNAIYSSDASKVQIINLFTYSDYLSEDPDSTDNYIIQGTISSVNYKNLDRPFTALAYAELTSEDGTKEYVMADKSTTRSVITVAGAAYTAENTSDTAKAFCEDVIETSLLYRINAVKNTTPDASNISDFDKKYAKVLNLYNTVDTDLFNALVPAEDIGALNTAGTAAKVLTTTDVEMKGTPSTLEGATELSMKNAGTPAAFASTISENSSGDFVLTENLDWNGAAIVGDGIPTFSGTLDGNGYTISNFKNGLFDATGESSWESSKLINVNDGTIKNIKFDFTITAANQNYVAIIYDNNEGTIENVYINVLFNAAQNCQVGGLVGINRSTIKNVIINMNAGESNVIDSKNIATVAAASRAGTVSDCYVIHNGIVSSGNTESIYPIDNGNWNQEVTVTNFKTYETLADFVADAEKTAFDTTNGWSSNWAIVNANGDSVEEKYASLPYPEKTILLNQTNAGTPSALKALLNATPDGHFILTSDIDLGGKNWVGATEFTGTLDGQGYSIKNFNINYNSGSDNGYNSYVFKSNTGTIKNIGFVFNFTATNNNYAALVYNNTGTLENIYVDATFASGYVDNTQAIYTNLGILSYQQSVAGTFKNIVINVNSNAESLTAQSFSAISYLDSGNTVENVHIIHNGITASCGAPSVSAYNWAPISLTSCGTYADTDAFTDSVTISEDNGWSEYWSIVDGEVKLAHSKTVKVTFNVDECAQLISGADCKVEAGTEITFKVAASSEGYSVIVFVNGLKVAYREDGVYTVFIKEDSEIKVIDSRIPLNETNAGTPPTFAALLNANKDGNFVLTSDLDWDGELTSAVPTFYGTLDGNGHAIKNFQLREASSNGEGAYTNQLFGINSGTIKNLHLVYSVSNATDGDHPGGLIYKNTGTVENCYMEFTVNDTLTSYRQYAAIASNNSGGTIKNCIVDLTVNAAPTAGTFGAIAFFNQNGGTISDSYVIRNGAVDAAGTAIPAIAYQWGTQTNISAYDTFAEMIEKVTSLDTSAGWNECWVLDTEAATLSFGGNVIASRPTYSVTKPSGDSFTFEGADSATDGDDYTFTVTPTSPYSIKSVTVNGNVVEAVDGVYTVPSVSGDLTIDVTTHIELNMTNAGTPALLKEMLNTTSAGNFVLTEDLDYTALSYVDSRFGAPITFSGTLDGQGHSIKGFAFDNWASSGQFVFEENSGTVKNIGFVFDITRIDSYNQVAVFKANTGTVENVYVNATFTTDESTQSTTLGNQYKQLNVLAAQTDGNNNFFAGTFKNCIVVLNKAEGVTLTAQSLGAIAYSNKDGNFVQNVLLVSNGVTADNGSGTTVNAAAISYPWGGTMSGNNTYASASAITELTGDGWNTDIWEAKDSTVYFNGTPLSTPMVSLTSQTLSANTSGVYEIDLSGVSGTIDTLTVNGTDRLSALSGTTLNLPVNGVGAAEQKVVATTTEGKTYNLTVNCSDIIDTILIKHDYASYSDTSNGNTEAETMFMRALSDFVALYKEITGIDIVVKTSYTGANGWGYVDGSGSINYSNNTLVLGVHMATTAGVYDETGLTTDTGYKAVKYLNSTFVYGKTEFGTANALYDILKTQYGVEFYTADVYTHTENTTPIKLGAITELFNPSIDYNWAYNGMLFEDGSTTFSYRDLLRLGYVNSWALQGGTQHDDNYTSNTTTEEIIAVLGIHQTDPKDVYLYGGSDARTSSRSADNAKTMIEKLNAVAEAIDKDSSYTFTKKIQIIMIAYNDYLQAPSGVTLYESDRIEVGVMFAPIEMNMNYAFSNSTVQDFYGKTNAYYLEELNKWKDLKTTEDNAASVYYWSYSTNFDNAFIPIGNLDAMRQNYIQIVGSGMTHFLDQGIQSTPEQSSFGALRVYLQSKLAKDAEKYSDETEFDNLIKNFCNAYYGAAGTEMYNLIKAEMAYLATVDTDDNRYGIRWPNTSDDDKLDLGTNNLMGGFQIFYTYSTSASISSRAEIFQTQYWKVNSEGTWDTSGSNVFSTWYAYISAGLEKLDSTSEEYKRVQREAIAIRYMSIKVHSTALVTGDTIAKVAEDAAALGITHYGEGDEIADLS